MFTRRFQILRLLGIPIYLDLTWFIVFGLFSWNLATSQFAPDGDEPGAAGAMPSGMSLLMGAVGALGLFASVLLHELSHCLVARLYRIPIRGITLFIFGGVAEMGAEPPSPEGEFFVAIAGPIASFVIAAASLASALAGEFAGSPPFAVSLCYFLMQINAMLAIFNMIPAFPLDGGRVLRAALWYLKGNLLWATRITSFLGSGFAMFMIGAGILTIVVGATSGGGFSFAGVWPIMLGLFLYNAASASYRQVAMRSGLEGEQVNRFMVASPITVPRWISVEQLVNQYFGRYPHRMYPVVDEHSRLAGSVTIARIRQFPREDWSRMTVGEIAVPVSEQNIVKPSTEALQAVSQMNRNGISRLLVVEDGRLEGLLTMQDMMKFLAMKKELEQGGATG